MSVNRYPGRCDVCGGHVPAKGGTLHRNGRRFSPRHLACKPGAPGVATIRFGGSDRTYTRNVNGRCEDAPCCGCCTI